MNYFSIRHYDFKRKIASHQHDIYEFVYYISGSGEAKIGDAVISIKEDCYTLIPPHVRHEENHFGYSTVLIIGFEINDKELQPEFLFSALQNQTMRNLVHSIRMETRSKPLFYEKMIALYASEALTLIVRNQMSRPVKNKNASISFARAYIDEYYMTEINLKEIASNAGYCPDRFRNIFKKEVGISPKKYILQKRLELAEKMLVQTNNSMEDICFSVGFQYYSHFSLFFKEKTGLSPLEYREKNLSER